MITQAQVEEDIGNAIANGCPIWTWTVDQIVDDMMHCCADYGHPVTAEELRPFVEAWKRKYQETE